MRRTNPPPLPTALPPVAGPAHDPAIATLGLDRYDQAILRELIADARISMTALADKIGLSKTPCALRTKRLEQQGFITGYTALIDPDKLGQSHIAFVQVSLSDTRDPALAAFNTAVQAIAEIEQCHMIAGSFDYLLKVRSRSMVDYRRVLGESISTLPHVSHTSTFVAMESVKEAPRGRAD